LDEQVKRPIKVIKSFIKWVKHVSTDEDFPFPYVSTYITIAAKRLAEEWDRVKGDPNKKASFIKDLKNDAKELRDRGHLENPRGVDDDDE
jgi:hypothetical protein